MSESNTSAALVVNDRSIQHEITEQDTRLAVVRPTSPMEMIANAVTNGAGIDVIERLVALQQQMAARTAELEFNAALNRAQTTLGVIAADLTNPQTRSKYASYAAIDRKVRPLYSREGLSLSFDTAESSLPEHVRVLCLVSHSGGHTRTYHVDMPCDGKGAKGGDVMTKTHATGAAMSYGMRYLVKMIFNIAVGDDDRDGNEVSMDEQAVEDYLSAIKGSVNDDELKRHYQEAFKKADAMRDNRAKQIFIAAKNARWKELHK